MGSVVCLAIGDVVGTVVVLASIPVGPAVITDVAGEFVIVLVGVVVEIAVVELVGLAVVVNSAFGAKVGVPAGAPVDGIVIGKSVNPINQTGGRILHLGIVE